MRQLRRSEQIFPYNSKSFSSLFPRACDDLNIVDLQFHDLRHEGVSRLFEAGYRIEQAVIRIGSSWLDTLKSKPKICTEAQAFKERMSAHSVVK